MYVDENSFHVPINRCRIFVYWNHDFHLSVLAVFEFGYDLFVLVFEFELILFVLLVFEFELVSFVLVFDFEY